jgi:hypothetical protein
VAATTRDGDTKTRSGLAILIIAVSVGGIVAISVTLLLVVDTSQRSDTAQLIFSSVLPLFGTWVGTVLAFYFARDNLRAATESARSLSGLADQQQIKPVSDVMIPDSAWLAYDLPAGTKPEDVKLADLHARMRTIDPPSRRLPIRTPQGAVEYVLHDATLTAYAESVGETTTTLTKTLADLLASAKFKELVSAIGFVGKGASINDARGVMSSIKHCNDVFVTESGKRDERAVGWLTNTLLAGVQ